jgi:hypothetical protein
MTVTSVSLLQWLPLRGRNHLWLLLLLVTLRLVLPTVAAEMEDPFTDDLTAVDRAIALPSFDPVLDSLYPAWPVDEDGVARVQPGDSEVATSSPSSDHETVRDGDDVSLTLLGDAAFSELSLAVARLAPVASHRWPRNNDTPPDPPPV